MVRMRWYEQPSANARVEFSFQRFLSAFDVLDPDVRRTTGSLVRKIDLDAIPQLYTELTSLSRIGRMRGLQMAPTMNAVQELEAMIMRLLKDEDHFIFEPRRLDGSARRVPSRSSSTPCRMPYPIAPTR